jgi:uncharacterized membrane-anchored protein YitT (DUF2179 family)
MLKAAKAKLLVGRKHPVINELLKTLAIIVGAVSVAAGLELFLVPNNFLDGGVTGVSILLTHAFPHIPLGVFIGILNIPFLFVAYKHAGFRSAFRTALGIASLSISTILMHHVHPLTSEFVLALGYGGLLLGAGVGIALRYGGALDGTEIMAVFLANRSRYSVNQIILAVNFCIFLVAAFTESPENAMASFLLFYVVVTPIIKKIVDGGNDMKTIQIMSKNHEAVAEAVHIALNRKVVFVDAHKDDINDTLKIVTTFCARAEESMLVEAIEEVDPDAVIVVTDAANLHGSVFSNNKHH